MEEPEARAERQLYLESLAEATVAVRPGAVRTAVLEGQVSDALCAYACREQVDLIVLTTHGRGGLGRWWVGSVADRLLHYVMPVLYLLFWFLFVKKDGLSFRSVPWFLIFPIGYAAYTLIRGPGVNWYPYPFIDASARSASELVINIAVLVVVFIVIAVLLVAIGKGIGRVRTRTA